MGLPSGDWHAAAMAGSALGAGARPSVRPPANGAADA
jgi:hypothetical protein